MPWRIGRSLELFGRALQSPVGESPGEVDSGPVSAVADVLQGGAMLLETEAVQAISLTGAAAEDWVLVPRTPDFGHLVRLHINKTGAAATAQVRLNLIGPLSGTFMTLWKNDAMDDTTDASFTKLFPGLQFFYVPPNFRMTVRHLGLTAPDTIAGRAWIQRCPAGMKVW